jgi:hypothetical protein
MSPRVRREGKRSGRAMLLAALIVLGLGSAVALQVARERQYPQIASPVDELYFRSGDSVGRLALSFKSVLADIYWIRAIQYFAATRLQHRPIVGEDLLYPLLDVTTTLDPSFNIAYRFGAIFLAEAHASGRGQPHLAVKLLDKGFAQNPGKWQYLYDKAFIYYWSYRDHKTAAHWFAEAGKVPDSAEWLPGLAAYMLAQGGDRRSSRFLFQQILATAEHEYMRHTAQWRLEQLDLLDGIDQLNAVLDRYARETGTRATSWQALISRGMLARVPVDLDGKAFLIDPATGHAVLDPRSKYNPLPTEPSAAQHTEPVGPSGAPQPRPPQ